MSNANVNHIGQALGTGAADVLFRDIYTAEVLTALQTACVTMERHLVRTITQGKSAKFPVTGIATYGYHVPGNEITGRNIKHNEKTIVVDDILYSDVFVAQIEELKNYFDVRAPYSKAMGYALAKAWDENVFRCMLKAARSAGNIPGATPGGSVFKDADYKTDATKLAAGLFQAGVAFDEKGAGINESRNGFVKPAQWALLVQAKDTINKLYGGEGSYARGDIAAVGGIELIKTAHLPNQDLSDDTKITAANLNPANILEKYRGDYSKTAAIISTPDSVGTVKLMDLNTEINYDPRRLGTLIVSKYALGTDVLRPECAVELATA